MHKAYWTHVETLPPAVEAFRPAATLTVHSVHASLLTLRSGSEKVKGKKSMHMVQHYATF